VEIESAQRAFEEEGLQGGRGVEREGRAGKTSSPVKIVRSTDPSSMPYMGTMERWDDVRRYESCMCVNHE